MPIYDVTVPLSNELPTWPSDPAVEITDWRSLSAGDAANVSNLNLGAHTGTHVDAPAHFIEGAAKVESLPLDALIGVAQVIAVPEDVYAIDEEFVRKHYAPGVERVVFKTRNSAFWSEPDPQFHTDLRNSPERHQCHLHPVPQLERSARRYAEVPGRAR